MSKKIFQQKRGMVDVGNKDITHRTAVASASVILGKIAFTFFKKKGSPKGDVLETARVAGTMAAKATPQLIPFCHPLELNKVNIDFKIHPKMFMISVSAEVQCLGRTGVEMEALTAAATAALTIYDMMKWADKAMVISEVKLLSKSGGKSGEYKRSKS